MHIPSFKLISQSMLKKSPENADGRTDGRTDGQTDGRTLPRHNTSRFSNGRIKYMVIHTYGTTLNAAKSADQYSSSYSYQSLSLINYLMYNDLHHDCKPYEQTR